MYKPGGQVETLATARRISSPELLKVVQIYLSRKENVQNRKFKIILKLWA